MLSTVLHANGLSWDGQTMACESFLNLACRRLGQNYPNRIMMDPENLCNKTPDFNELAKLHCSH